MTAKPTLTKKEMESTLNTTNWRYNPAWSLNDELSIKVWDDPKLSFKAKGVFAYMTEKRGKWDFSCERIAKFSSDGKKAVMSAINELIENGYVNRKKLGNGRMNYVISGEPYVGIEPEIAMSPHSELKVNMDHESMYDGENSYGKDETIGEIVPMPDYEDLYKEVCTEEARVRMIAEGVEAERAYVSSCDYTAACDDGGFPRSEKTFRSWLEHELRKEA